MDPVPLVEGQIDDGLQLLDRLAGEGVAVRAACWVKPVEEDRWTLYIATPLVDEGGKMSAYREVYRVLRQLESAWMTVSDITVVGEKHPITQELLDLQRHFSGKAPTRYRRPLLGNLAVEEIYIYPLKKEKITVYGMVFCGDPGGTLNLSFVPHNPHAKLTVENGGQRYEYPAEVGKDWVVAAPGGATLERDEVGRMVLAWDLHGHRMTSSANEVWTLAKLGLHGFRFLREPAVRSPDPGVEAVRSGS